MYEPENLEGYSFGRLTIIGFDAVNRGHEGRVKWICQCQCGNIRSVLKSDIRRGDTKSCGCLRNEMAIKNLPPPMIGANNPNYGKRGTRTGKAKSSDYILDRTSLQMREWRDEVYKRDGFTCQRCFDSSGGNLEAHHIASFSKHKDLRFSVANGITLCKTCHREFHRLYGVKRFTEQNFYEWMGVSQCTKLS